MSAKSSKTPKISKYFTANKEVNETASDVSKNCLESPYKKLISETDRISPMKRDNDDDDFKTPKPVRIANIFNVKKPSDKKVMVKSKTTRKTTQKKKTACKQVVKNTEDNFKKLDVNAEHLQMALAISKSEMGDELSEVDLPNVSNSQEKAATIKATLEQFGFKSRNKLSVSERRQFLQVNKRKKSKFQYVTPILYLRTEAERIETISSKISIILNYSATKENKSQLLYETIHSDDLKEYYCQKNDVLALNQSNLSDDCYYVDGLNIPRCKYKVGSLLKSWESILGRDKSPIRELLDKNDKKLFESVIINEKVDEEDNESDKNAQNEHFEAQNISKCSKTNKLDDFIKDSHEITTTMKNNDCKTNEIDNSIIKLKENCFSNLSTPTRETRKCKSSYNRKTMELTNELNFTPKKVKEIREISPRNLSSICNLELENFERTKEDFCMKDCNGRLASLSPDLFDSDEEEISYTKKCISPTKNRFSPTKNSFSMRKICENQTNRDDCSINVSNRKKSVSPLKNFVEIVKNREDSLENDLNDRDNRETSFNGLENSFSLRKICENQTISANSIINISNAKKKVSHIKNFVEIVPNHENSLENDLNDVDTIETEFYGLENSFSMRKTCESITDDSIINITISQIGNRNKHFYKCGVENLMSASLLSNIDCLNNENCDTMRETSLTDLNESKLEENTTLDYKFSQDLVMEEIEEISKERSFSKDVLCDDSLEELIKKYTQGNTGEVVKGDELLEKSVVEKCSLETKAGYEEVRGDFIDLTESYDDENYKDLEIVTKTNTGLKNSVQKTTNKRKSSDQSSFTRNSSFISNSSKCSLDSLCLSDEELNYSTLHSRSFKVRRSSSNFNNLLNVNSQNQMNVSDIYKALTDTNDYEENPSNNEEISRKSTRICDKSLIGNASKEGDKKDVTFSDSFSKLFENSELLKNFDYGEEFDNEKQFNNDEKQFNNKEKQINNEKQFNNEKQNNEKQFNNEKRLEKQLNNENQLEKQFNNEKQLEKQFNNEKQLEKQLNNEKRLEKQLNNEKQLEKQFNNEKQLEKQFNNEKQLEKQLNNEKQFSNIKNTPKTPKTANFTLVDKTIDQTPDDSKMIIEMNDITPMPNYTEMNTPSIAEELKKFGLKPLKRKKGVQLLKYIYDSTHPEVGVDEEQETSDEDSDIRVVKRRKEMEIGSDLIKEREVGRIEIAGDLIPETESIDDLIFERKQSVRIHSCRLPLQIAWYNFLSVNPKIHESILLYEPLEIEALYGMLKREGFKYHIQDLLTFFDKKCITVRINQKDRRAQKNK